VKFTSTGEIKVKMIWTPEKQIQEKRNIPSRTSTDSLGFEDQKKNNQLWYSTDQNFRAEGSPKQSV
jgi:hypothetical protein